MTNQEKQMYFGFTGDSVHAPLHYKGAGMECIDAMAAMLTHAEFIGYLRGNVFKYL